MQSPYQTEAEITYLAKPITELVIIFLSKDTVPEMGSGMTQYA